MRRAYGRWTFKREMQQESGRFPKIPLKPKKRLLVMALLKKGLKLLATVAIVQFFLKHLLQYVLT